MVGSRRGKGGAGPIIGRKERKQAPAKTQLLPQFSTKSPGRYEDDEICEIIMNNVCDVDKVPVWKKNFFGNQKNWKYWQVIFVNNAKDGKKLPKMYKNLQMCRKIEE